MLPPYFGSLVEFFVVLWGVLILAYALHDESQLKYSAGTDFQILFLSLDLNAILNYATYARRINPRFAAEYLAVFVVLVVFSTVFVVLSVLTQNRIDTWRAGRQGKYPLTRVVASW